MPTTISMALCDPQQETDSGMAGILHWQQPRGEEHCLMRLTFIADAPIIVLSKLISSPAQKSFLAQVAPAANAAYSVIQGRIKNPADIIWLTHSGPFSTPDTLWTADVEDFSRIHLHWNEHEFEAESAGNRQNLPIGDPYLKTLSLEPVDAVLRRLGWRNWRDER